MYRFISVLFYLIIVVYICAFLLVYTLPLFGFQFVRVESNNESLGISAGDSMLIYPKEYSKIIEGDVIAFSNSDKTTDIKQVVSKSSSTQAITVLLKENKIKNLTKVVLYKDVLGVKVINLPKFQGVINFLNNIIGKMLVAVFAGAFLILWFALGGKKRRM